MRVCWVFILAAVAALGGLARPALGQDASPCVSSIRVLFNQYGNERIEPGSTIWFSSVLEAIASPTPRAQTPLRIDVTQSRITFGNWPYVVTLPDSTILLDDSAQRPVRRWTGGQWSIVLAPSQVPEAFFDGIGFAVPEPFVPGFSGPVTWTATFRSSRPGVTVDWAWSAAVYSRFGRNGYLNIKPTSAAIAPFDNDDPVGTPEFYKRFVIPGAMGNGAPQYVGARSASTSIAACESQNPAPAQSAPAPAPPTPPPPAFASRVTQRVGFGNRTVAQAVAQCFATDLCALVTYPNGDRLAIYSEGAAYCEPYVLYVARTNGDRTIYAFSRNVDHDVRSSGFGPPCGRSRTTHVAIDGGRIGLTVSENGDGTLRFEFDQPRRFWYGDGH